MLLRFTRFNLVGALGVAVQLAAAALLVSVFHLHYLAATILAVEIAVLHNFTWHERWTWGSLARLRRGPRAVLSRCLAFHAGNGCVSVLGTLVLMPLLVGRLGLHYLLANLVAIAATAIVNFVVADRLVFAA